MEYIPIWWVEELIEYCVEGFTILVVHCWLSAAHIESRKFAIRSSQEDIKKSPHTSYLVAWGSSNQNKMHFQPYMVVTETNQIHISEVYHLLIPCPYSSIVLHSEFFTTMIGWDVIYIISKLYLAKYHGQAYDPYLKIEKYYFRISY